ncbi:MAG TPA: alkaline phosphatase family protein [Burkholderiales bacterium]|nr:alkaline phosphatase family protein [Burkholderiales bacterium]
MTTRVLAGVAKTLLGLWGAMLLVLPCPAAERWSPAHVVIVILENRSFQQMIGHPEMPYLNSLALEGALMTRAYFAQIPYGVVPEGYSARLPARPSQPNYLYLFSGHDQGMLPSWFQDPTSPYVGTAINDSAGNRFRSPLQAMRVGIGNHLIPASMRPFTTPNLGAALIASGRSFASFSESLPDPRYDKEGDPVPDADLYRRKHNPAINWVDFGGHPVAADQREFVLPVETNLGFTNTTDPLDGMPYRGFAVDEQGNPIGYDRLPTVSIVVPNEQHDLHSAGERACNAWLEAHIRPYADWARDHDSLLIVTFDEDGTTNASHGEPYLTGIDPIVTLFYGPPDRVVRGRYDETIDHLNVLATVLDRYGLLEEFKRDFLRAHGEPEAAKLSANLRPIRDVFGEGPKLAPIPESAY